MRIAWVALLAGACGFHAGAATDGGAVDASPGLDVPIAIDTHVGSDASPPIDTAFDSPVVDAASARKRISITVPTVAGTQHDFPMWVDVNQADFQAANASGSDIYFTDATGAPIAYQIQSYDGAHHLQAWVKVGALTNNSMLYLCFGDASMTQPQDPAGTFSNGFSAVWHLEDTLADGNPIADATGTHDGSDVGLDATHAVTTTLGKGIEFDGADSTMITFTNPLSGATTHTISLWITTTGNTGADNDAMIVMGDTTEQAEESRWFHARFGESQDVALGFYGDDWTTTGENIETATPHLLHWVFEGNNTKSHLYVDGTEIGTYNHHNNVNTQGTAGYIGWAPGAFGQNMGLHGIVDEVRISTDARDANWVATEWANQSSPSTFYQLSAAASF
ncbi:MAG TPA: DUF2341 domain-containing protein [Kofleriaceae bacterium]|jgi:hypothetical protein